MLKYKCLRGLYIAMTLVFVVTPSVCRAQNKYPHADDIVKKYDADGDGELSQTEVSKNPRYFTQFVRWDADKNGKVTAAEIVSLRKKFGIAADGSTKGESAPAISVPDISDLARIDRNNNPTRDQARNSAFVLRTNEHAVDGDGYVILTDHTDEAYLASLRKLAQHHDGDMMVLDDLAELHDDGAAFRATRQKLCASKVKYVAIAPRLESFRENTLLGMWELLSTLDADPQLDCFPGFLVATNPESFASLIEQSVVHTPITLAEFKPFAINQVRNATETRSLQKSAILRKHYRRDEIDTPIVAIYGETAEQAPRLTGDKTWNLSVQGRKQFVKKLPPGAQAELAAANLVVMHGHGIPGMSCSLDVDGIPDDCTGKVILSGSCFSASPVKSDLPKMSRAPGGYSVEQRDAFILRAIDNGAIVAFGHQRLSSGFPHLYPVLEGWTDGMSVGHAYQRLLNALIDTTNRKSGSFIISEEQKQRKRIPQNSLLYVVIGDPALKPFAPR